VELRHWSFIKVYLRNWGTALGWWSRQLGNCTLQ